MAPDDNNDWLVWSKYVLMELEKNTVEHNKIVEKLDIITAELITLKVKAGIWGAIAGSVPVIIGLAIAYASLIK